MERAPQGGWTIRPAAPQHQIESPSASGFALVAQTGDGAIIGQARVLESDGSFHLIEVFVTPAHRRMGVGAALMSAIESEIVARGASALTLLASEPSVDYFDRLGYATLPQLPVALRWLDAERPASGRLHRAAMGKSLAPGVVPRPAVSVLPLRDTAAGIEVFAQHRVATMDFAAGAVVFPGGRIDPGDHEAPVRVPAHHQSAWANSALPAAEILAAAAIREVAEECGVTLDAEALVPWDNWVTPPGGRRRFDVAFFVTVVAAEDANYWANTTTEAVRSVWESVRGLLADEAAGRVRLMPPTKALLTELAGFASSKEVLAHAPLITPVLDDEPPRPRPPGRPG